MQSLGAYAKDKGVKYFLIAFVDLFGTMRAKIVPATAIDTVAKAARVSPVLPTWLDLTPAHPDMLVMPDPDTLIQLPWKPEIAWVTGDLVMDGKPLTQNPRQVLKRVVDAAAKDGYEMKTGVECEYFLIEPDGSAISDGADTQAKPCYDQQALMRRYEVIKEICDGMIALGWNPYQNDHEDANGQFEMNWEYDTCLKTADKHAFFKFMVKSIAEKHGLRATFMPKPFLNLTGNGCHAHVSLWNKAGKNVFEDAQGKLGLSPGGLPLHRRADALGRGAGRHHQPDRQLLQAHQCAAHDFGRHLVAQHRHLRRQQPHAHDPHPRCRPLRAAPRRRRGQPLSAAGGRAGGGARRRQEQARSGPAPRHRHVRRRPHGEGCQAAAAQPAGRAARARQARAC